MTNRIRTTRSTLPNPQPARRRAPKPVDVLHMRALHLATVKQFGGAR